MVHHWNRNRSVKMVSFLSWGANLEASACPQQAGQLLGSLSMAKRGYHGRLTNGKANWIRAGLLLLRNVSHTRYPERRGKEENDLAGGSSGHMADTVTFGMIHSLTSQADKVFITPDT